MLKPFPITQKHISKSPFTDRKDLQDTLNKWKSKQSIGFTRTASLKAMGLIPRSSGLYVLSSKYKD